MAYKNKEDKAAAAKRHYDKHKEKILSKNKEQYLANPKKHSEIKKEWYLKHKKDIGYREKRNLCKKTYLLKLNLTNKNISGRTLSAWSLQVRTIQPKCMTCGSTEDLHAHHIAPKIDYPELALLLLNGITLCEDCHIKVHSTI